MENPTKFLLPSPNFGKKTFNNAVYSKVNYLTPSGMTLLPRGKQPPPMYGPRGSTVPPKFLPKTVKNESPKLEAGVAESQYCAPCEMSLPSLKDLHLHCAQHQSCPIDGCKYRSVPSVMDKHISALHTSGLYEKFKKLSTPEEIAAWREERRKKYPTVANVQMKKLAQEQKQRRGERLESNQARFGNREDRKRTHTQSFDCSKSSVKSEADQSTNVNSRNRRRQERRKLNKCRKENYAQKQQKEIETKLNCVGKAHDTQEERVLGGIFMFKGTSALKDYKHIKNKKVEANVLSNLLGMYGSDSEEESEDNENEHETCVSANCTPTQTPPSNASIEQVIRNFGTGNIVENSVQSKEYLQDSSIQQINLQTVDHANNLPRTEMDVELSSLFKLKKSFDEVKIALPQNGNPTEDCSDDAPDEEPITHSSLFPIPNKLETAKQEMNIQQESQEKHPKRVTSIKSAPPRHRKYGLDYRKARLRKQNTMLEKLLESDIIHERNVLLQCVRYVCENNFFRAESKNS